LADGCLWLFLVDGDLRVVVRQEVYVQLFAGGGFIQVFPGSKVVILADAAERVTEIDVARAEEAAVRAKDVLEKSQMSDREYAATSALLDRNLARLKIVRKHAHRRSSPITSEGVLEE
jgi:F-type H+-transporting ATPase subunit epsilon